MVIPIFKGSKGENLEVFLKEYIRTSIGTGFRTAIKWFLFFLEFLEGRTSHWFE
jgi:hypothetical protein